LAIALLRAVKLHLHTSRSLTEQAQQNWFADSSAGAAIALGANTLFIALLKIELFRLENSDYTFILAVAGGVLIFEGMRHVHNSVFARQIGKP